jgi:hypothetical protein
MHTELAHLTNTLKKNGYFPGHIHRGFWPRVRLRETDNKQKVLCTTFLPCVQNPYNCVSLILARNNIKTIHLPLFRTCSVLRPIKDSLGLKAPGICKTLCGCRAIFIGEAGCMIHECKKEHQRNLWLYHLECSAVTKYSARHEHRVYFGDTTALAKLPPYTSRVIWKATDINLCSNFNKEGGYQLPCLEDHHVYGEAAERLPQTSVPITVPN